MKRSGFTLLEMILALAIGVVLMISLYGVLNMQVQQAQQGRLILQEGKLARGILNQMASDILCALGAANPTPTSNASAAAAGGTSGTTASAAMTTPPVPFNNGVYGANNLLVLTLGKLPNMGSDPTQQATASDLRRISYWLVANGGSQGSGLAKQEIKQPTSSDLATIPPDVTPDSYEILASEVKDVIFEFFDGSTWQASWDGTTLGGPTLDVPIGPPSAIRITLTLNRRGADNTDLPDSSLPKYQHVVAISAGNNFPQTNP